jgi:hypothetical protein
MFNRSVPRMATSGAGVTSKAKPAGRERLSYFVEQIAKASEVIESLELSEAKLDAIIVEAATASRALQEVINSEGGVASLAAYAAGNTKPDDNISKLVSHAKTSSDAASAARDALPITRAALEDSRSQLISLSEQKHAELTKVVAQIADQGDGRAYKNSFDEVCRRHDELSGYAQAVEGNIGTVRLIVDPLRVPRFALPSMGDALADPFLRYQSSQFTIDQAALKWKSVRDRLDADAGADVNDLLITERTS